MGFKICNVLMLLVVALFFEVTVTSIPAMDTTTVGPVCTLDDFGACLKNLVRVSQGKLHGVDFSFAATKEQLANVCSTMKFSVICIDNHMMACFTDTQKMVFNQLVSGARQVLKDLCVPGHIQDAYLNYAPCYKNITMSEEKCGAKYRTLIEMAENVREKKVDNGLKEACCAFKAFVECKHKFVREDCGTDASMFLQQYLDRITSPLLHHHCSHLTYGPNTCMSISFHGQTFEASRFVLLLFAIFQLARTILAFNFAN